MLSECKTSKSFHEGLSHNHFHNVLRLFDALPNFPFTTSEKMRDYYFQPWYIRVDSRVAKRLKTLNLRKLRNIRKVSKPHRMITQCTVFQPKLKFSQY